MNEFDDALRAAYEIGMSKSDSGGVVGFGVAHLIGPDGETKQLVSFGNLITDAGDLYVAGKVITGIAPASPTAPTAMSGMKLGTGTTAVAKSGAGGALVTYLTASNLAFDTSFPATVNLGAGLGVNAQYKTTWGAGVATSTTINEVVIVNDAATNATSTAANTGSRAVLTTVNKGAADTLAITWNWKYLGV